MRYRLLQWLRCPACDNEDLSLQTVKTVTQNTYRSQWAESEDESPGLHIDEREVREIVEGSLHCEECGAIYPITDGIPRMMPHGAEPGPSSGHRWTTFDGSLPEYEENFLDMAAPLTPSDYIGKRVLDAGCGFGRHAFFAARYGAEVVALDNSADAVASARDNTKHLNRVHVIQGDLRKSPLRPETFDLAYSFGVLHHLDAPKEAFAQLTELVKSGGSVQVWVYGPRAGSAAIVSGAMRGAASNMEDETLHRFSRGIASGLRVFSHTPYRFMRHVPGVGAVVSHLPAHDHHQWPFEVVVADIYDRLRIPVTHYLTGEELEGWFADGGFADIRVTRRVRNAESFRGIGTRR